MSVTVSDPAALYRAKANKAGITIIDGVLTEWPSDETFPDQATVDALMLAGQGSAATAAEISVSAVEFWQALRPQLPGKGHTMTVGQPTLEWLVAYVAAIPSGTLPDAAKDAAIDALKGAVRFERSDPQIDAIGALLGFTSAEIDAIFITAADAAGRP